MSAEFQFEDSQWQSFLKKINKKWKDIEQRKSFADLVSVIGFGDIIDHFENEEGPQGKWKSWSAIYSAHMARIGKGGNKILQDSGRLRNSLTPGKGKVKTNNVGVLLFTNVVYGATHQYGYKNIPARPFMWLSKEGMKRLVSTTEKWLLE